MPRKPNYRFERFERERTKAAKKAARAQAKADKKKAVGGATEHDSLIRVQASLTASRVVSSPAACAFSGCRPERDSVWVVG